MPTRFSPEDEAYIRAGLTGASPPSPTLQQAIRDAVAPPVGGPLAIQTPERPISEPGNDADELGRLAEEYAAADAAKKQEAQLGAPLALPETMAREDVDPTVLPETQVAPGAVAAGGTATKHAAAPGEAGF